MRLPAKVAALVLAAAPALACARPYTVDDLLAAETFGQMAFTPDGSTLSWTMVSPPDTRLRAERKADKLHLQGTLQGKAVDKQLPLGDKPWFQSLSYSLSRMVALKRAKTDFWFLRSDELELLGMRAELAGKEQMVADGKTVAAQRVRIKLDSLIAAFWEASYWFRETDQVFLRYRGVNGPPGTDETMIDLQQR